MLIYNKPIHKVLKELETSERGISGSEVIKRQAHYGKNVIKVTTVPLWRKLIEPFANVFILILIFAVIISFLHGDMLDAYIILAIIVITALIYYLQRFSTERIMRTLQKHQAQAVETLRNNKLIRVDSAELVPGDVIILGEGEKIPADARLIEASNVRTDEALLTGESTPISKKVDSLRGEKEVYKQANMLFQGSFIVSGTATAVVVRTGNETEFGQIAALAKNTNTESPVQKKIDKLITQIIAVVFAVAIVIFALAILRGMELTESFKFIIALSVSAVPESLPVAISVVLAIGMRRMAHKKALVRNMGAIESIGVITTIATDKTGTLTKNKLTVQETWQPEGSRANLMDIASQSINQSERKSHDPLDIAMLEYTSKLRTDGTRGEPLAALSFDQAHAMSGNIWHHGKEYELSVKGAPEQLLARSDITDNELEEATTALHHLTSQGYRVLAIGKVKLKNQIKTFSELTKKDRIEFAGFLAVADVLRPEAKRAVNAAQEAGVTVRMITGDHFETAYHIGRQIGMVQDRSQVFDSRKMEAMTDEELSDIIDSTRVFSRVAPEHKYRILALLKQHHITAMTGDGVNDVPALANAHVGIAMGSGSHIAKDAGDIVLLDDNFKSIIEAMREGRTIFTNIRRMLFYLLSTNSGEVLTMLGALVVGLPVPLLPVQILWVNLVTDTSMVIPLGLEPGEKNVMKRRPNHPNSPILSKFMISRMVLVASCMAVITLGFYALFEARYGHEYARTIAFNTLVVMQWANAFNARSDYESVFSRLRIMNAKFYAGLALAVILQLLALFSPLGDLLHIEAVNLNELTLTGTVAFIVTVAVVEIHKHFGRNVLKRSDT